MIWDVFYPQEFEAASLFNVVTWPLGAATEQAPQPEYDRPLVLLHHLQHSPDIVDIP